MKKKRIAAAGLAVIMALTAAGCHQTLKEDTAQTTVKENKEEKDTSKEQIEKEETEKKQDITVHLLQTKETSKIDVLTRLLNKEKNQCILFCNVSVK